MAISVDTAGSAATTAFVSQDGILYTNDLTTLVAAPAGLGASARIAPECTAIAEGAFWGNTALQTIVANGDILVISTEGAEHPSGEIFPAASEATIPAFTPETAATATVVLPAGASRTAWEEAGFTHFQQTPQVGQTAQDEAGLAYTMLPDFSLQVAWAGTSPAPTTLEIPETAQLSGAAYPVSAIAIGAFDGQKTLQNITLPESIRVIGDRAFASTSINTLVLPAQVVTVGSQVIDGTAGMRIVAQGTVANVAPDALGTATRTEIYVPYNSSETYAWPTALPAAGNRIYPYGVRLNPAALNLEVGQTANLFTNGGYLHAPGNVKVTYKYSAKTVNVNTETGDITAKRTGKVNVDVTLDLPTSSLA